MISIIARFKMQAGKEDAALECLRTMVSSVQAQEPGALAYICHRSQNDPSEIVFFEVYADDATFQAHAKTPHMGDFRAAFGEIFDTPTVTIERLERVAGVVRP